MEVDRVMEILEGCSGRGSGDAQRFLRWVMVGGLSSFASVSSSSNGKLFRKEVVEVIAQHL